MHCSAGVSSSVLPAVQSRLRCQTVSTGAGGHHYQNYQPTSAGRLLRLPPHHSNQTTGGASGEVLGAPSGGTGFHSQATYQNIFNGNLAQVSSTLEGAPDRKVSVRPENRTRLIKAGYRPDRTSWLLSTISDDRLFLELDREYDEKQSKRSFQNNMKNCIFSTSKFLKVSKEGSFGSKRLF